MSRDCVMHIYIVAATLVATVLRTGAEAGLGGAAADLAQLGVRLRSRAAHSLRRARKRLLQIVFKPFHAKNDRFTKTGSGQT